jgi:hypothetical protein
VPLILALFAAAAHGEEGGGEWKEAGTLSVGRYAPAAALLPDGRVLLAGGYSFETGRTDSTSELFDPVPSSWAEGPRMRFDRNFPLALPLPGGDALFIGGFRVRAGTTATTERLDARALRFAAEPAPAHEERELASAAPLPDGRFLITGGYSTLQRKTLDSAEIYDPKADRFTPTAGSLHHRRFGHASAVLPDGRVLIVGGKVLATDDDVLPAELFDPTSGQFAETGSLAAGRDRCTAWLVADKSSPVAEKGAVVLVAGGSARQGGTLPAKRCELYDPAAGTFRLGPELIRDRMAHAATPLDGGRVLLTGGWSGSDNRTTRQAELWDPASAAFRSAGTMRVGRHDHAAVRLRDGRVLVAGGKEAPARNGIESPLEAETWTPSPAQP